MGNTGSGNERSNMKAKIDGVEFIAATTSAEISGNSIIITGSLNNRNIKIIVPVTASSGTTYPISTPGYGASYYDGFDTEVALSGSIRVNAISSLGLRVFFSFTTEHYNITEGRSLSFF